MKSKRMLRHLAVGAMTLMLCITNVRAQSADSLINKLREKGILTEKEPHDLKKEAGQTNLVSASQWSINDAIKNISRFGDLPFRYEYRGPENLPSSGRPG